MGRRSLPTDEFNLTERERKVLDFMKKTAAEKGYPPTVREICQELNVKSTSTIHKAIEIVGFDRHTENTNGPASGPASFAPSDSRDDQSFSDINERSDVIDIPLVGQVAAGTPILAKENITDAFPVPSRYVSSGGSHFMLTVKGESMIEAGIFDGDYILVRQQNVADNGEMVVAMVDGFESEATVKTFYREDGHIRLQPENSSMSPIIVRDARILGIVKGVFRYFS